MALENLTGPNVFIGNLDRAWPEDADFLDEGDDHVRGIKNVLQNSFPNIDGAVTGTPAQLNAAAAAGAAGAFVPTGAVLGYAGVNAPPPSAGYLPCNGAAVSRTTYAALFAAIGTVWGAGDGSTTFNVPNLARRVTVGLGGTATAALGTNLGDVGGEDEHILTVQEMPAHAHSGGAGAFQGGQYLSGSAPVAAADTGAAGGGLAHNNIQQSAVMWKIIKT